MVVFSPDSIDSLDSADDDNGGDLSAFNKSDNGSAYVFEFKVKINETINALHSFNAIIAQFGANFLKVTE